MSSDKVTATPPPPGKKPHCPYCGAEVHAPGAADCWLCVAPLGTGVVPAASVPRSGDTFTSADVPDIRLPEARGDNPAWIAFGVLAVLLIVGLAVEAPG